MSQALNFVGLLYRRNKVEGLFAVGSHRKLRVAVYFFPYHGLLVVFKVRPCYHKFHCQNGKIKQIIR